MSMLLWLCVVVDVEVVVVVLGHLLAVYVMCCCCCCRSVFVVFVGVLLLFLSHPWALGGTGSWGLACAVFPVFCQESAWRSSFSLTSLVALHTDTS